MFQCASSNLQFIYVCDFKSKTIYKKLAKS